jgi:CheY-like chemotaxis protein
MADPTQIHQVLMNLCTNAAHAMRAKGGTLTVELRNVEIGQRAGRQNPDMAPGPYLKLSIIDTGHGMDEAVKQRLFDPYFTTKGPDEGTGMGLAVVYGIVKNLSGTIAVSSKPSEGATFEVYFPRTETILAPSADLPAALLPGRGLALVVDDEKSIAVVIKEMLEALGYTTLHYYDGTDALEAFRSRPESFDFVVTDLTMPRMTGIELAKEILAIRPNVPIILCTGFTDSLNKDSAKLSGIRALLMKPVSMRDLRVAVHNIHAEDRENRAAGSAGKDVP